MEIRATGLSGPRAAANSSTAAGDGESAFAAELGVLGSLVGEPHTASTVPAGEASRGPKPLAGSLPALAGMPSIDAEAIAPPSQSADRPASAEMIGVGETSPQPASGDQGVSLLGGAFVHAPTEVEFDLGLPQTHSSGDDEALSVAPNPHAVPISMSPLSDPEVSVRPALGDETMTGRSAPELDQPVPMTKILAPLMQPEGSVLTAPDVNVPPALSQKAMPGGPELEGNQAAPKPKIPVPLVRPDGTVLQPRASGAVVADSSEDMEISAPLPQPLDHLEAIPDARLTDVQRAPSAPINDLVRASITASAQTAQTQSPGAEPGSVQESAAGLMQRPQPAATEASETSNIASDPVTEAAAEPFMRPVQNAPTERAPLQLNSAPAPLPPGQPGGQAAAPPLSAAGPVGTPPAPAPQAEVPPMVTLQADKVAREMGIQIARRVASGGDELVIRLDPAELGRINIRMSVNEQGQLRAIVAADAPSVVEAIRSDISELSRALEQAGVRTDSQSFRFDRGGSGDPGGQWQQRYQQQNSATRQGEANGLAMSEDETAYRPLAMNGRINMMA